METITLRTIFTTRCDADRRIQHVAHVIERRTCTRRHTDRMIQRGTADTMAALVEKLRARGLPTTDDGWK